MPPFDGNFFAQFPLVGSNTSMEDLAAAGWRIPIDQLPKQMAEPPELSFDNPFSQFDSGVNTIQDTVKNATGVDFSIPEMNKLSNRIPDFFIDAQGKIIKNRDSDWKPGDALNIELQSSGQAIVNANQGAAIQTILNEFLENHPGSFLPRTWQDVLDQLRQTLANSLTGSRGYLASDDVGLPPSIGENNLGMPNYTGPGDLYGGNSNGSGRNAATSGESNNAGVQRSGSAEIRPEEGLAPPVVVAGKVFPVEGYNGRKLELHHGSSDGAADIFAPEGTPIRAMMAGQIISVGSGGLGGNTITIRQADGKVAYYAHMQAGAAKADGTPLKSGDRVETGEMIGRVGQTGNAAGTGSHLHLGVGDEIQSGSGPEGGAGTNFNLTGTINSILASSQNA